MERHTYTDPITGYRVTEITAAGKGAADNLYYHFSNFTADNRHLIFTSDRTGSRQIYRASTETGEIVQLTDAPKVAASQACPDPNNPSIIYFLQDAEVYELNIESLHARKIGTIPQPRMGGYQQPTVSNDGKWLTIGKQRDPNNWEIGVMEIRTGEYRTVITQGFRIGHVQHSPKDDVIFYVWETGGFAPQRSWLVNRDGTGNRPMYYKPTDPKQWLTPLKEWLTHEAWVHDTGNMTMVNDKVGIMLVSPDGSAKLVREGRYWHCAARPDGKYIALDDMDGRIWLAETATGNIRLLATGTRDTVRVHSHLSFDRQGRYLQFHTGRQQETVALIDLDAELTPQIYDRGTARIQPTPER